MKKINLLIISLLLLASCEKTIDVRIEDKGRKLVVNSIFAADSLLGINLLESTHIQSGSYNYSPVSGASISLFENDVEIESLNTDEYGVYLFNHKPVENANYEIVVNTDKYGTVNAKSYVPEKTTIEKIEYELNESSDQYSTFENIDLKLYFKDKENKANFYLLLIYRLESYTYFDYELNENVTHIFKNYVGLESYDPSVTIASYNLSGLLFNDELFDGKLHTLSFFTNSYSYSYGGNEENSSKYYIALHNLSEDLYNYYLSYSKYQETKDNPFSEPVKVYNNIENGFGIFGGSSIAIDSVEIEIPNFQ